eukprot:c7409_g1_i1.p1 GENE.c7409_g1_i1~~c7409_g1_i1.p1  ORF type:complete len:132 (+),score=39.55 c7409_g1_i1:29-397(+)
MKFVLFFLLFFNSVFAVYEVGKWRVGRNCGVKDDVQHPNSKTVTIEFLNQNFENAPLPVVIVTVNRPDHSKADNHFFSANVLQVDRAGFVVHVQRLDNPGNKMDIGWCYDDLDISWMAYSPV